MVTLPPKKTSALEELLNTPDALAKLSPRQALLLSSGESVNPSAIRAAIALSATAQRPKASTKPAAKAALKAIRRTLGEKASLDEIAAIIGTMVSTVMEESIEHGEARADGPNAIWDALALAARDHLVDVARKDIRELIARTRTELMVERAMSVVDMIWSGGDVRKMAVSLALVVSDLMETSPDKQAALEFLQELEQALMFFGVGATLTIWSNGSTVAERYAEQVLKTIREQAGPVRSQTRS
jgi:hypothetical protein